MTETNSLIKSDIEGQGLHEPLLELSKSEERILDFFEGATQKDWEDWRWQIRNRIRSFYKHSVFVLRSYLCRIFR